MKRARAVRPDQAFQKTDGEVIGVVSEDEFLEHVVAVARHAYFAGGIVQIVQERHPTGVPAEMVTVGALIHWQDRTDAKAHAEPVAPAQRVELPADEVDERDAAHAARLELQDQWRSEEQDEWTDLPPLKEDPEPEELEEHLEAEAQAPGITREQLDQLNAAAERGDLPEIPEEAVVIGAPVGAHVGEPQGYATPNVKETPVTHTREHGSGAGALPFQKGDQPGDPPRQVDTGVNLNDIVHGDTSAPARGATPAPAGSSEGIDDGFVPEAEEDDSSVPEHLR